MRYHLPPVTYHLVALVSVLCVACGGGPRSAAPEDAGAALLEVALPDLSRLDAAVQAQVRERHDALATLLDRPGSTAADRAAAYGSLAMVLDAAEYHDAAEPAYVNAQALARADGRWPYYLAHLYRSRGEIDRSIEAFSRVLELAPDHAATLVWVGRLHLEQGDPGRAESFFERARASDPGMVAALAGLGQAALANRDYARAAALLAEAVARDPSAASIHSPLATAYRALGDPARAETHAAQWRNTEILVPDSWRQELDLTLESGLSYELRGVRALERRDFAAAAGFFAQGAELEPARTDLGRSLRHKLGTALYLSGDPRGAVDQFEEVVRLSPSARPDETAARAHYSLGIAMASTGRDNDALAHLTAAVKYGPNYVEALLALGDALRRAGRASESLVHYRQALSADARSADARVGYAMALVRLGRHREALEALSEGARLHADRPVFALSMARLLSASPDDNVRDDARAMALVDRLLTGEKTIALGETTAMALAETGNYSEAAAVQRQVMDAAVRAGLSFDRERMTAALRLYEREQPCRTPWADDDPALRPDPPAGEEIGSLLARTSPESIEAERRAAAVSR